MLRRTKALVASELPPKVETVMRVELTGAQADLYETIRLGMERRCAKPCIPRAWPNRRSPSWMRCSSCARSAATRTWCRWSLPARCANRPRWRS